MKSPALLVIIALVVVLLLIVLYFVLQLFGAKKTNKQKGANSAAKAKKSSPLPPLPRAAAMALICKKSRIFNRQLPRRYTNILILIASEFPSHQARYVKAIRQMAGT